MVKADIPIEDVDDYDKIQIFQASSCTVPKFNTVSVRKERFM